jgi:uncharacterized protein YqcC (DUF446 family)
MHSYELVASKADEIEAELKRLGRWIVNPLPDEYLINMGAFGSNTMGFEQWLQFVLIPRIREIVKEKSDFPAGSNLAPYGIRYFDGDTNAERLQDLLYSLDQLINQKTKSRVIHTAQQVSIPAPPTVSLGDTNIPSVLYSIAEALPQFELKDLESQLQTFDTFLSILSPTVRPTISTMLKKAADQIMQPECKKRIEQAAQDVADGKRAAPPYNHEEAMKKYQEEHKKNFPLQSS